MTEVRDFYVDLRQSVRNAQTRKTLLWLNRESTAKLREFSDAPVSLRKQAQAEHRKTSKLIARRMKQV